MKLMWNSTPVPKLLHYSKIDRPGWDKQHRFKTEYC